MRTGTSNLAIRDSIRVAARNTGDCPTSCIIGLPQAIDGCLSAVSLSGERFGSGGG
jgi:hypothetical protein